MAVKAIGTWVGGLYQTGWRDVGSRRSGAGAAAGPNWRLEVSRAEGRLECAGVCVKPVEDVKSVEDEDLSSASPSSEVAGGAGNGGEENQPRKLNRDLPSEFLVWNLELPFFFSYSMSCDCFFGLDD